MKDERKFGWTEKGVIGGVFLPIGVIFLVLGGLLWYFGAGDVPEDPMIFLCVFGGMGAAFALIGGGLLWADVRRRRNMRRAFEGGYYVMADVAGVQARTNVNIGKTHPRVVECHFRDPDTGVIHVCFSRYLYFDPTDLMIARQAPVYMDRATGKGLFVDIDAILPPVELHR